MCYVPSCRSAAVFEPLVIESKPLPPPPCSSVFSIFCLMILFCLLQTATSTINTMHATNAMTADTIGPTIIPVLEGSSMTVMVMVFDVSAKSVAGRNPSQVYGPLSDAFTGAG